MPSEWIASVAVGFAAGITSTVLTGWAQVSDLGRAIIFLGSCLSGALFAYWAARSSSVGAAFGKSALGGALQANISATVLLLLAYKVDAALHISPTLSPPGDLGAFALIILIVGSIVGVGVGLLYAIVPSLVAHWRMTPSLANTDRAMFASAAFLATAAFVHASIVSDWAAWAPLALFAFVLFAAALVRTRSRARFMARVRAGLEPRYRLEPAEGRSVLYRIAKEDERERYYREATTPAPPPEAIGVL